MKEHIDEIERPTLDEQKRLIVNSPAALAAMMRQAQSDPFFREKLVSRGGIPFGALASALSAHASLVEQRDRLLERVAAMQAVVNAASLWEAASAEEDEDSDEGYETAFALEDAVKAYRAALAEKVSP